MGSNDADPNKCKQDHRRPNPNQSLANVELVEKQGHQGADQNEHPYVADEANPVLVLVQPGDAEQCNKTNEHPRDLGQYLKKFDSIFAHILPQQS